MADNVKVNIDEEDSSKSNGADIGAGGNGSVKGNETETGPENKGGEKSDDTIKGDNGKVFTQEQVNKMMAREKNQGRSAALKELGLDPGDSKMAGIIKAFIESQKTDEQVETEEKDKIKEANMRAMTAEAKAEAMILGVKAQFVDDVVTLALAKMTEDSDMKTIIGEFKIKYPVWFGETSEDGEGGKKDKNGKVGQKGTGSSIKNSGNKNGEEKKGLGARLAAQKKGTVKKSIYWGS